MDLKGIDTIEIIKELNDIAPNLPASGFVAGGAVAAILNRNDRGVNSPIRDVDIFMPGSHIGGEYSFFLPTDIADDLYGSIVSDIGYRILSADRSDNLNLIKCQTDNQDGNFEKTILSGFDLNCCQAGIQLLTGELYYTADFLEFLQRGVVYITNVGTPYHSAIRLFTKTKDVKGECNYYGELYTLALSIHLLRSEYRTQQISSHKLLSLGDRYKSVLETYFTYDEGGNFSTLRVKDISTKELLFSGLGECVSATEFIAKVQAIKKRKQHLVPLLSEPIAYKNPEYLQNYRDVTMGDIEIRRDNLVAIRMGWNIGQHCLYSRCAAFSNEIHRKIECSIRNTAETSIVNAQRLTVPTPERQYSSEPVTAESILDLLNAIPESETEPQFFSGYQKMLLQSLDSIQECVKRFYEKS